MPSKQPDRRKPQQVPKGVVADGQASASLALAPRRDSGWTTFALALSSGLLVWTALPPLGWWPLGWVAPVGWLVLIQREKLPGRRPYWGIYGASAICWALTMQGIRLAHWANYLGLVALGGYLGIYVPLFVAIARVARHQWHVPLVVVAPVVWVGVEVGRGYGPLGFSMALLGHTQVRQMRLIQIADLCGPYTVSFAVMFVAACVTQMLPGRCRRMVWWPLAPLVLLLVLVWTYGGYRLGQSLPGRDRAPLRVALIQGSIDTMFDGQDHSVEMLEQYSELTSRACDQFQPLDLVMWPETMFPIRDFLIDGGASSQPEPPLDRQLVGDTQMAFQQLVRSGIRRLNQRRVEGGGDRPATHWIFGASTWQLGDYPPRRYNAAIWANPQAEIAARYFKMRPVIFGEYVPFGDIIPALYNLFPLPNGLTPGTEPAAWDVQGYTLSPSICFENTMPHLIRWQVAKLAREGRRPDVLINVTNDGWFWGSSILDMQLNCAVLRAVELRRPFLVAANTGFSAWIDGNGTVLARGPRRATGILVADVVRDGRSSMYEAWGDAPALCCTLVSLLAAVAGLWRRWSVRRRPGEAPRPGPSGPGGRT